MTINSKPPSDSGDPVEEQVAQGDYLGAARRAKELERHARATELFEKVWEFAQAAECAHASGQLERALRNAIDSKDETLINRYLASLVAQGDDGKGQAAAVLASRRRFQRAAELSEEVGNLEQAFEWYEAGHSDLDAARVLELLGRDSEAGRLLERVIAHSSLDQEQARAHLALGLILARRMRHEDAVRHLQSASRYPETRNAANRMLVVELAALDLLDAARDVLAKARREDPSLPLDLDALIRSERPTQTTAPGQAEIIGGRYRLEELIGTGGVGRVYRATDEVRGRHVAVKLFATAHVRGHEGYERFVREAKVASSLRHPNLVEAYDFSAQQGYLVMELMVGGSLRDRLADRPAEHLIRRMILDVLGGLELAHQRGIIHRDIKPANIFFDGTGTAKLGDFGVAHLLDLGQTQTGGLIGTLAYMSPEQITGAPLTIAADLYALGITLFEALSGHLPFPGPDFVAEHLGKEPPALLEIAPELHPGWADIIDKLLAKVPSDRLESPAELRKALQALEFRTGAEPLLIPRAQGEGAAKAPPPSPKPAPAAESEDAMAPRYDFETPLGRTDISVLSRAVDRTLDRSIVIERFQEMSDATESRLFALARAQSPFVQRSLAFDRETMSAVFEAPSGSPLSESIARGDATPRHAIRFLKRMSRAIAPLHELGHWHGAISEHTVLSDEDGYPTLMAAGLGPANEDASAQSDVAACLALALALLGSDPGDLLSAFAPDLSHPERLALQTLAQPATGVELYELAHAVEIAVLRSQPVAPKR